MLFVSGLTPGPFDSKSTLVEKNYALAVKINISNRRVAYLLNELNAQRKENTELKSRVEAQETVIKRLLKDASETSVFCAKL